MSNWPRQIPNCTSRKISKHDLPASRRQLRLIKRLTGKRYYQPQLTMHQAGVMIDDAKAHDPALYYLVKED